LGAKVIEVDRAVPVISWNESMCCSAAEFISAGASVRGATPSSLNGSIGTRLEVWDFSRMLDRAGVDVKVFASGKYKAAGHPAKALTEEQTEYLEGFVSRLGAEFQTHMAMQRPLLRLEHMQGQLFTGSDALAIGLVDLLSNSRAEFVRQLIGR
jgi:protease IV